MNDQGSLLRRIRLLTALFITGLFLSGATAIPLQSELDWIVGLVGQASRLSPGRLASGSSPFLMPWLTNVQTSLHDVTVTHPFLFYGTDWLAFGHFMIALAFVGALRDPVRNIWLFDFGLLACLLVIPYALIFGAIRGIPFWWRLIDCSFGVFGFFPLWFCRRWTLQLARMQKCEEFMGRGSVGVLARDFQG